MEDKNYKEIEFEENAIVNTQPAELPEEAQNIPQGEFKPETVLEGVFEGLPRDGGNEISEKIVGFKYGELNPNPGYGEEDGKTHPATKTVLVKGEIKETVQPTIPGPIAAKVVRERTNFIGGLFVNGQEVTPGSGGSGGDIEVIEWDGERNFTQEEIAKLAEVKACVKHSEKVFYVQSVTDENIWLLSIYYQDDGIYASAFSSICIYPNDGTFYTDGEGLDNLTGTKLYKHYISNDEGLYTLKIVSNRSINYYLNSGKLNPITIENDFHDGRILYLEVYNDSNEGVYLSNPYHLSNASTQIDFQFADSLIEHLPIELSNPDDSYTDTVTEL